MTVTTSAPVSPAGEIPPDHAIVGIDDREVVVPKGTLIIRAAEQAGVEIPRFCDHPLLDPVAACRACLVEIEGQPKPQPACAIPVADGMRVRTAGSSPMAEKAQRGVLEFLLINHPLDCPVCDKGGECPLQNQAMSHGPGESRFTGTKRTFPKPVALSTQILLDRERCVSCARCTRFADQIAGDPFISLQQRGAKQIVGISADTPFNSYFSGNTVQICPVGALTSAAYRFRARPFDLVSTPTVCEHCASGCALRTDVRRSRVLRRLAWEDAAVNEDWNCDKGRFAFPYLAARRIVEPTVRAQSATWPEALRAASAGLLAGGARTQVLVGGKLPLEDAYAYSKFARKVLGTDNVEYRIRRTSTEEADFLRAVVAGSGLGVTYADLEAASAVLLIGLEPEEESPIIFLRLRKANRRAGTRIFAVAPFASPGTAKLNATVLAAAPGGESAVLGALTAAAASGPGPAADAAASLGQPGAVILVGERAGDSPGTLAAAVQLAAKTGARLAYVPRRAGERGALEAGLLPGLLPWGRPLSDPTARAQVAAAWDTDLTQLSSDPGTPAEVYLLAGVDHTDLPDPAGFLARLEEAEFVVAMDIATTEVTRRADVVFPVAALTEKSGTFLDWEGRARPFAQVISNSNQLPDARVLGLLARTMGRALGSIEAADLRRELAGLGRWDGPRGAADSTGSTPVWPGETSPQRFGKGLDEYHEGRRRAKPPGVVILASWRYLLDEGVTQTGEPALAGTARPAVARMSSATATAHSLSDGQLVRVTGPLGHIELPLVETEMVDGVVWVPTNSAGSRINLDLGAPPGEAVQVSAGGAQ
ncbi:MAG: NADH-quinone oxidoreductase subunit G [Candidatus Nanopelagicales bacterium]